MMTPTVTTTRLTLRRFVAADLDFLVELYADEEVARFVGGIKTRDQAKEMLETRFLAYYDSFPGMGIWMTLEKATGLPVGLHLINHIQGESLIQIGYIIARSAWGMGYATEMCRALMPYAFTELKLSHLCAITDPENLASQRVLLKVGLERRGERTFGHPAYAGGPLAFFEIEAQAWWTRHGSDP